MKARRRNMRMMVVFMAVGFLGVVSGWAGWAGPTTQTTNGTVTLVPTSLTGYSYSNRDGSATFYGNPSNSITVRAQANVSAYDEPDFTSVTMTADVNGYKLKKLYTWDGCGTRTERQFDVSCTRKFDWYHHGNCGNWWGTSGTAEGKANGQFVINTSPDNAGDETSDFTSEGEKTEGGSWLPSTLTLAWPWSVSLTWDISASSDDEWKDDDDKTENYAQNIRSDASASTVYIEVTPYATAKGRTETNAIRGCGDMYVILTSLTMTIQP